MTETRNESYLLEISVNSNVKTKNHKKNVDFL